MKKTILFALILLIAGTAFSQTKKRQLPAVNIKTPSGETFNTANIRNDGEPIILSFWAQWCSPCISELDAFSEVYSDWQDETGVKLYAISIDDVRRSSNALPFANGRDWDFEVLLDPNSDFKRALNFQNVPQTFILDGKGNIVWQHTSFAEGGEHEIIKLLRKVANGEDISEQH
ncbi:MAG: TlpA family protein disulfide reductase [Bacteroidales bacterium]|nr:TlpA family protein disulfide reductase [Bacteroidales bacterium]